MSLTSSIFGEVPASAQSSSLFGSKAAAPAVSRKKSRTKKLRESDKSRTGDEDDPSADSDSASLPPASSDAPAVAAAKVATRKTKEQLAEEEGRTIFVGNLPPDSTRKSLAGIFQSCGAIASTRLRSMAVSGVKLPPEQAGNQNMMRKVCANTGKILSGSSTPRKTAQGYVVFKSAESVDKALRMNNTSFQSHAIRVDRAKPSIDPSRSVFVGNLPYAADEQTLREHFSRQLSEGEDLNEREGTAVTGVRLIRDKETQKCKGFGYVMLRDATLVPLALQLHGTTYQKRELRVMISGKRFKRNGGDPHAGGSKGRRAASKRKPDAAAPLSSANNRKLKKRRARSDKKAVPGAKGMSKRAATEQKVKKRVKKLQHRAVKGMGRK